ncbi:MAG TPA: hypothetical protein DDZ81_12835 [Acetobacteraceae bacterium]|nr:hypothetical protein [Acetobacteraceae bacterium]
MVRRLLFALLLTPVSGFAQTLSPLSPNANAPMPRCGPDLDGQTMCRFGVIYECVFISPNSMERRTGWRWKSDVLRACDPAAAPADLPSGGDGGVPPGFTYAPQTGQYGTQSGIQAKPGSRPFGQPN